MAEVAVAIARERIDVGVAFSRTEASEGSKPGGGNIYLFCTTLSGSLLKVEELSRREELRRGH